MNGNLKKKLKQIIIFLDSLVSVYIHISYTYVMLSKGID